MPKNVKTKTLFIGDEVLLSISIKLDLLCLGPINDIQAFICQSNELGAFSICDSSRVRYNKNQFRETEL